MMQPRSSPARKMGSAALHIRIDRAVRSASKSVEPLTLFVAEGLALLAPYIPGQWKGEGTILRDRPRQMFARASVRGISRILLVISSVLFAFSAPSLLSGFLGQCRSTSTPSINDEVRTGGAPAQGNIEDQRPLKGFSLIAACMNCHAMLNFAFGNWRELDVIDEVVLVDWSSTPPIHETLELNGQGNIRIVRVSGEAVWVPSRAFNIGIYFARFSTVGLTDFDLSSIPSILNASSLPLAATRENGSRYHIFYHCRPRDRVSVHRSSHSLVISRELIQTVGGYDERIVGGNRDVTDLIERLERAHAMPIVMDFEIAQGTPIVNSDHSQSYKQVYNDLSWLLVQDLEPWSEFVQRATAGSSYTVAAKSHLPANSCSSQSSLIHLRARSVQASAVQLVSAHKLEQSKLKLLGSELHDTYGMPWEIMTTMTVSSRARLLAALIAQTEKSRDEVMLEHPNISLSELELPPPRFFVLHAMHGLGNRIRALTSAMAFAEVTGRQLVIVWETDEHCKATFVELFESEAVDHSYVVIDDLPLEWSQFGSASRYDAVWRDWLLFNYMETEGYGARKDRIMQEEPGKHIYFKSAYVLSPADKPLTGWDLANRQLQYLYPVAIVKSMVARISSSVDMVNAVGVHIRSLALQMEKEIDPIREYGKNETEVLNFWRSRSDPQIFFAEMRRILRRDPDAVFYVASDSMDVVSRARELFPGRIFCMKEEACDNRSAACLQIALADMILLGKTGHFLGSPWSSFTEGAQRFGAKNARIAGIDFGPALVADAQHAGSAVAAMVKRVHERRSKRFRKGRGHTEPTQRV